MFSNPNVTFTHQPPLPSLYISPFTLALVSALIFLPLLSSLCFDSLYSPLLWFFSPPFTLCKPKVTGFMRCMHDVGKCQVVDFFSFHSPPPFFSLLCFLSFAGLCGWGFGHICSYKFQPTNMTSFLYCA